MADNRKEPQEVPVYLFTGFLESGKSSFIQETLEDPRFNDGEQSLLLLCEEGEVELEPSRFSSPNVTIEVIEDPEELNPANLMMLRAKCGATRVICEYNGMWLLDALYSGIPDSWAVYQEYFFADSGSILTYNANMRQLTFDKLQSCELAIFNRCTSATDQMELHKLVRTASRRAQIVFEYADGTTQYDEIEDPLPFDLEAPIVVINDEDYAIWYRDMSEDMMKYEGKTVMFTGRALTRRIPSSSFIIGRHVMTCCAEDIQFAGLVCNAEKAQVAKLGKDQWVTVTATLHRKFHTAYGRKGPVLTAITIAPAKPPEPQVATFY